MNSILRHTRNGWHSTMNGSSLVRLCCEFPVNHLELPEKLNLPAITAFLYFLSSRSSSSGCVAMGSPWPEIENHRNAAIAKSDNPVRVFQYLQCTEPTCLRWYPSERASSAPAISQ